jgi:hypothetical protein
MYARRIAMTRVLLCIAFILNSFPVLDGGAAERSESREIVYVRNGVYHVPGCRLLSRSEAAVELRETADLYRPCRQCAPPQLPGRDSLEEPERTEPPNPARAAAVRGGVFTDDVFVEVLSKDGVTVYAALQDTGWKVRANLLIVNESDQPVEVSPADFQIVLSAPKPKKLPCQSPELLARLRESRPRWSSHAIRFGPAGPVVSESGDFCAAGVGDFVARLKTEEAVAGGRRTREDSVLYIQRISLRADTLMPGDDLFGAVYFDREAKARSLVLTLPVGVTTFEFPFSVDTK